MQCLHSPLASEIQYQPMIAICGFSGCPSRVLKVAPLVTAAI